jgi:glycosyltransferase involved in cell wall biosynthesis
MANGVSVIVCCYNSETRIEETMRFLSAQNVQPVLNWEVIVVNNASTDNTSALANRSWRYGGANARLRVVDETNPGLSFARQRGIWESSFNILIFCDDDNHLEPDYVMNAWNIMEKHHEVGIAGGWIKPKLAIDPGSWIKDFYPALAIGKRMEHDGLVDWVYGAGMVLKREIFEILRDRNIKLLLSDRMGSKQTSGGDDEISLAAQFVGFKIYYSNSLVLYHSIAPHRLNRMSFIRANYLNAFPIIYLYLMENLSKKNETNITLLYRRFCWQKFSMIFHFLPRIVIGKHRFYSFMMVYQNVQLLSWMVARKARFNKTAETIKANLYQR